MPTTRPSSSRPTASAVLAALGILAVAPGALAAQRAGGFTVQTRNTLTIERPDATIGIPWRTVQRRLAGAAATNLVVREAGTGTPIVSQVVDDDGDGTADELLFQASYFPGETKRFTVARGTPAPAPDTARVVVRHEMPRDDMAWESDRIAYRMYGQGLWKIEPLVSSGLDVWVKRVRYPIVDRWYAKGHDQYHHDNGEGADFFDVGTSLGAGGTAIWTGDTLVHARNFRSYRIIAQGPIRVIFEVQYDPWTAGGVQVAETKRISLDAGHNLNRVVSIFHAARGRDIPFVVGLEKRPGGVGSENSDLPWAWLTNWAAIVPKDGGHGEMGDAVIMPRAQVAGWKEAAGHYLVLSHTTAETPVTYYVGAGWTGSGDFRNATDWWNYVRDCAARLSTPVAVTIIPSPAVGGR